MSVFDGFFYVVKQGLEGPLLSEHLSGVFEAVNEAWQLDQMRCVEVLLPYAETMLKERWAPAFPLTFVPGALNPVSDPLSPPWFMLDEDEDDVLRGFLPPMRLLRHLNYSDDFSSDHPHILGDSPHLGLVESLDIWRCDFCTEGPEALEALLHSNWASQLRYLNIGLYNYVEDKHVQMVANSASMSNLCALSFQGNEGLGRESIEAIVRSPFLSKLEHLDLKHCMMEEGSVDALLGSGLLPRLKSLDIGVCFGSSDIERLWRSPELADLEFLGLGREQLRECIEAFGPASYLKISPSVSIQL